jgi:CRISPR system Cascade subunit CasA
MILFEEQSTGEISHMRFVAGQGFENPSRAPDPMQPYKTDITRGKLPVQFREDRGTWRDFDSLLPDDADLAPLTVQNALRLAGKKVDSMPGSILVLGLRYEPPSANVDFWRMERFVLPEALSGDRFIRTEIRQLLTVAEESQKSLWAACSSFARDILSRGDRKPVRDDIKGFVKQMTASSWYWSTLESHFHEILSEYSLERDFEDIRCQWLKSVRETLQSAWEQHRVAVCIGDAWAIRALVKAERLVWRKVKELDDEIMKLEPKKEAA